MRLSCSVEEHGFFWMPEDSATKLPGFLCISESGEATLKVSGISNPSRLLSNRPFIDPPACPNYKDQSINRIVGIIKENKLVTLDKCMLDTFSHSLGGLWSSTYCVDYVFIGANYHADQDVTFSKITFSVEGLDEWLSISGLTVQHQWEEKRVSIDYKHPQETTEIRLTNEMSLKFTFSATLPSFSVLTEAQITQKAYICLTSNTLRPLADFIDLVFKLQNFLCFAITKTVSIKTITGYSSELTQEIGDRKRSESLIEIYYKGEPSTETKPKILWHDMIFHYRDIADNIEKILGKWIDEYTVYEQAFNLYFSVSSGAYKYLDGKFLALVNGIEILHRKTSQEKLNSESKFGNLVDKMIQNIPKERRKFFQEKLKYANEPTLQKRMQTMIKPFERFFGNARDRTSFSKKIADKRNHLIHCDDGLADKAVTGEEFIRLHYKLEALFRLHILWRIGVEENTVTSIVEKNRIIRQNLGLPNE